MVTVISFGIACHPTITGPLALVLLVLGAGVEDGARAAHKQFPCTLKSYLDTFWRAICPHICACAGQVCEQFCRQNPLGKQYEQTFKTTTFLNYSSKRIPNRGSFQSLVGSSVYQGTFRDTFLYSWVLCAQCKSLAESFMCK